MFSVKQRNQSLESPPVVLDPPLDIGNNNNGHSMMEPDKWQQDLLRDLDSNGEDTVDTRTNEDDKSYGGSVINRDNKEDGFGDLLDILSP